MYVVDSSEDLEPVDRWFLDEGDPRDAIQRYKYNQRWETVEDVQKHSFYSLETPKYRSDLNKARGGSLILDDGAYLVPFRSRLSTVSSILTEQTEDSETVFRDERPGFLELAPSNALEKYRLHPVLRGTNEVTGTHIVDEVVLLERGSEEEYSRVQVDELAEDHFVEQLAEVDLIDSSLAELLIEEYGNIRTVSWATTSDVSYMENTWELDCHQLHQELNEEGILRNEHSPDAGKLHFPERRADELSESRQEKYFGEVLESKDGDEDDMEKGYQVALGDF